MVTTQGSIASNSIEMENWLQRQWYSLTGWQWLLWPLSQIFLALSTVRRRLYRAGIFQTWRAPVPVIVVGNISVGGTGKTPLTIWLARFLTQHGYRPGIVSRGYGSKATGARSVATSNSAEEVGDEPLLLARRSGCPVWVGRDRASAVRGLLAAYPECNLLICDDGLQHYALARDVEIAVGGLRSLGNGRLLPAGPLREKPARLQEVDMVVASAEQALPGEFSMRLTGHTFRNLQDPARTAQPQDFAGRELHAVAGIGQPQRFYDTLRALGLKCTPHSFPDHYPYRPSDLQFEAFAVVLMTEKDAVKCAGFAQADWWYLEVDAQLDDGVGALVLNKLRS